jgi:hypothetical protein
VNAGDVTNGFVALVFVNIALSWVIAKDEMFPFEVITWVTAIIVGVIVHKQLVVWVAVFWLGLILADWWRRRKDRKRGLTPLGAKAKARLAAMGRKMRETAQPGPRPVPVPQEDA